MAMNDGQSKRLHQALSLLPVGSARDAVVLVARHLAETKDGLSIFWGETEDGWPQVELDSGPVHIEITQDVGVKPKPKAKKPAVQKGEFPRFIAVRSPDGTALEKTGEEVGKAKYWRPAGAWTATVRRQGKKLIATVDRTHMKLDAFETSEEHFREDNAGYLENTPERFEETGEREMEVHHGTVMKDSEHNEEKKP